MQNGVKFLEQHNDITVGSSKVGDLRVMTSKPVVLRVPITELPMLVERKSKQTALNDKPEPMSLPINDLS